MIFSSIKNICSRHVPKVSLTLALSLLIALFAHAQPGAEIEVEKPKKYENRKLGAEKTTDAKISFPKKAYQNTVTHYNYYFNANRRLNELIENAKMGYKDDYSTLLSFYNYTLDATATNKQELDSIVYKCTAGILLHDLRNSWIDDMFLILGKAYFYRKDFDSAALTFQYINFSFAPKEGGNYDVPIGSNASNDKGEFSIVSKEKKSIWTKLTSKPPSRNESFIWQARNFIERNELSEAAGIIEILRHDPNFPKRLNSDLKLIQSYWFYKQQVYDSSAIYLTQALDRADNGMEKARWEYLAAQMFQLSKRNEDAVKYYERAMAHTADPVMDVYARLNSLRLKKTDKKDYLQDNIDDLVNMAKKDKYINYRDIIYFAAANIELERKNYVNAQDFLLKSVRSASNNPQQRSQSFLLLADMNYDNKAFTPASYFYDSIDVASISKPTDSARIIYRRPPLKVIADNLLIVSREDSLQSLAKLTPRQQDSVIKKQLKLLKKAKGEKEEDASRGAGDTKKANDLFAKDDKNNDFYFYSASTKARGFNEFKTKWGERPNTDNWRRKSAIDKQSQRFVDVDDLGDKGGSKDTADSGAPPDSYEGMQASIPRTPEKMAASDKSIVEALYTLGNTFENKLEEYPSAQDAYEQLLKRYPNSAYRQEAMFNLVYLYQKTGNNSKAEYYKKMLQNDTAASKWKKALDGAPVVKDSVKNNPATKKYEEIYNLFIEGKFTEAIAEKKIADSLYNKSYWTPQLLFIEAIYYIKQQEDSTAIKTLTDLSTTFPNNQMAEKAKSMIDVLKRRKDIERYLTELQVTRNVDSTSTPTTTEPVVRKTYTYTPKVTDSTGAKKDSMVVVAKKDPPTAADSARIKAATPVKLKTFNYVGDSVQYVAILLNKVDPVYQKEARNAFVRFNAEKYYSRTIDVSLDTIDAQNAIILEKPFNNAVDAIDYVEKVRLSIKNRILSWLSPDKYSIIIISRSNLELLKTNKEIDTYKQLLQTAEPGKF